MAYFKEIGSEYIEEVKDLYKDEGWPAYLNCVRRTFGNNWG